MYHYNTFRHLLILIANSTLQTEIFEKRRSTGDFPGCWCRSCWDPLGKASSLPSWCRPVETDGSDLQLSSAPLHDTQHDHHYMMQHYAPATQTPTCVSSTKSTTVRLSMILNNSLREQTTKYFSQTFQKLVHSTCMYFTVSGNLHDLTPLLSVFKLQPFIRCLTELRDTVAFNFLLLSALKVFWLHGTLIIYVYNNNNNAFKCVNTEWQI